MKRFRQKILIIFLTLITGSHTSYLLANPIQTSPIITKTANPYSPSFRPHTIYINAGYAFITSKLHLSPHLTGHPKNGPDWQLGYEWVSKKGLGAGMMYSGYKSSYSHTQAYIKGNILLSYFAPQFVIKQTFGNWTFEGKCGIGYFNYKESVKPQRLCLSGVGYNCLLGTEYALSEYVGIGINLGYIGSSLQESEYMELKENEFPGIFRLHLNAGLRFHF